MNSNETLALHGGAPVIQVPFKRYNSYGPEEVEAARAVVATGKLSGFYGSWIPAFMGGDKVRAFESAWASHFNVAHAVAVNSATSGLMAAVGAVGIEPGDEVIVTPLTMSATATAIVLWQGVPVFSDVQRATFNLDPAKIEAKITDRTRAIAVTDMFGHAADMNEIMAIAKRHGLRVIEDAAQSPGARYHDRYAGALADIGIFSLNYHKHIHTGEGGMCVTSDERLAERLRLIRNHAENVVGPKGETDLVNMVGFNFRMGEIEAAMGIEQLKKLPAAVASRQRAAERLSAGLAGLKGLRTPLVKAECSHVYYVYPLLLDPALAGVSKQAVIAALKAEGVEEIAPAFANLHLLPMYQKRIAFGGRGAPWSHHPAPESVRYDKGSLPVVEELREHSLFGLQLCMLEYDEHEVDLTVRAFQKVWRHLHTLTG